MTDPYQAPQVDLEQDQILPVEYVGFWARTGASIVDSVLMLLVLTPILYLLYGKGYFLAEVEASFVIDLLLNYLFPAIAAICFWIYKSATPGKMLVHAKIIDAQSGGKASTAQLIGRYLSYYLSAIPLGLGFFWVAFDARKQGWHDKLAGTLVVRDDH